MVGNEVGQDAGAGGGEHPLGVEDVLEADGDAVKGPSDLVPADLILALPGIGEDLFPVDGHPRMEGGLEGVDPVEKGLGEGDRGNGPLADFPSCFGDAELVGG